MLRARQYGLNSSQKSSSYQFLSKSPIVKLINNQQKSINENKWGLSSSSSSLKEKETILSNQRRTIVNDTSTWYKKFRWLMMRKNKVPKPPKLLPVTERTPGLRISAGLKSNREFKGFRIPYVFPYTPSYLTPFQKRMDHLEAKRVLGFSEEAEVDMELFEDHLKWSTFNNHPDLGGSPIVPKQIDMAQNVLKPIVSGETKKLPKINTIIDADDESEFDKIDTLALMDIGPENREEWVLQRIRRNEYYYRKNENVLGGDSRDLLLRHFKLDANYMDIEHPLFPKRRKVHIMGNPNALRTHFSTTDFLDEEVREIVSEDFDSPSYTLPKEYTPKYDVMHIIRGTLPPFQTEEFADFFNKPKPGKSPEFTPDGVPFFRKYTEKETKELLWQDSKKAQRDEELEKEWIKKGIKEFRRTPEVKIDPETGEESVETIEEIEKEAKEELEYEERRERYLDPYLKLDFAYSDDVDVEEAKAQGLTIINRDSLPKSTGRGETLWNRDYSGMYVWKRRGFLNPPFPQEVSRTTRVYRDELPEGIRRLHPYDRARAVMNMKKIPGSFLAHTTPRWGNPFFGLETEYFDLDKPHHTQPGLPDENHLFYDEGGDALDQILEVDWQNAYVMKHLEDEINDESLEYWQQYIDLIIKAHENQRIAVEITNKLCLLPTEKMTMEQILEVAKPLIKANLPIMLQYEEHELITNLDVELGEGRPLLNIQSFDTDLEAQWFSLREWLEKRGLWDEKVEEPELAAHRKKMDIEWIAREDQHIWERHLYAEEILHRKTFNEMQKAYNDMLPLRTKLFKAAFYRKLQTATEVNYPLTDEERKMLTPQMQEKFDHEYRKWAEGERNLTKDYDDFERAFQKLRHDLDRLHRFISINAGDLDWLNRELAKKETPLTKRVASALRKRAAEKRERQKEMPLSQVRAEAKQEKENQFADWDIDEKDACEDITDPYVITPEEAKAAEEELEEEMKKREKEREDKGLKPVEKKEEIEKIVYEDQSTDIEAIDDLPIEVKELAYKSEEDYFKKVEEIERSKRKKEEPNPRFEDGDLTEFVQMRLPGMEWWKKGVENFDNTKDWWKGPYRYGYVPREGPDPTVSGQSVVDQNFRLLPKDAFDEDSKMQFEAYRKADRVEERRIAAEEAEGIIREWKSDLSPFSKTNSEGILLRYGAIDYEDHLKQVLDKLQSQNGRKDVRTIVSSIKNKIDNLKERKNQFRQRRETNDQ